MKPDIMNPDEITYDAFFKFMLPRAAFTLLGDVGDDVRRMYLGATKHCLYAIVDGLEILWDEGAFHIYGIYGKWRDFEPWCVMFCGDKREQLL